MEENAKRVLHVEINDDVRKLTIEGVDKDQQVVMRQELNEDELGAAIIVTNRRSEVDAEHRQRVALLVAVLMGAHLDCHNVLLQQSRQDGAGNSLVLHQILKDNVVYWVSYFHTP